MKTIALLLITLSFTVKSQGISSLSFVEGSFTCTSPMPDGSIGSVEQENKWLFDGKIMELKASTDGFSVVGHAAYDRTREIYYLSNADSFGDVVLFKGKFASDTLELSNLETNTVTLNQQTGYPWLLKFKVYKINENSYGLDNYVIDQANMKWRLSRQSVCTRRE